MPRKTFRLFSTTKGLDLVTNENGLSNGLRRAMNVVLDKGGHFRMREGAVSSIAGAGMHSLYYASEQGRMLVARGSTVYEVVNGTMNAVGDTGSFAPVAYAEYNGKVYFGNDHGRLMRLEPGEATARKAGIDAPDTPTIEVIDAGELFRGVYGVTITLTDDLGEESAAADVGFVEVPNAHGLRLTHLPSVPGWLINVFITSADGSEPHRVATVPASVSKIIIKEENASGRVCETRRLDPLPAGEHMCWHNGRLFTATGNVIYFSEALRPHLYDDATNWISMQGRVRFIGSVGDTLFAGDDRGVWALRGADPTDFKLDLVSQDLVVAKSAIKISSSFFNPQVVDPEKQALVWLSSKGYVVGMTGGTIAYLNADRVRLPKAGELTGRSAFTVRDGVPLVVTLTNSNSTDAYTGAVDSYEANHE
jgi:hypothetical protein